MVALYTEGFCITNICFSLDIYVKLIKSLPNQATQLTASPPPLGTEKDRKSKSSSFLSSVPKYKYRVLLFYRVTATQFILYMVPFTDVPIVISPSVVKDPNMQYGSIGMLPTCSMI